MGEVFSMRRRNLNALLNLKSKEFLHHLSNITFLMKPCTMNQPGIPGLKGVDLFFAHSERFEQHLHHFCTPVLDYHTFAYSSPTQRSVLYLNLKREFITCKVFTGYKMEFYSRNLHN